MSVRARSFSSSVMLAILLLALGLPPWGGSSARAATPAGFTDTTVLSGLTQPTSVRFSPDGRIFVAEKSGKIKVFSSLTDTAPRVFADLSTQVDDYWDRGLLGMALPPDFPTTPYVYVLYAYDAPIGGTAPTWNDTCPNPPGGNTDGCVVSGRLSRLQAAGDVMTGTEQVLVNDWCQQYPSHSLGDLAFSADGTALYASGGDGASFNGVDYGQLGDSITPGHANPCGDPPGTAGTALTLPTAEGGALRAQSVRRPAGEPTVLDGAILRLDPATGNGLPGNPYASSTDANARRVLAAGVRNSYRFAVRPGTNELWAGDVGWNDVEEINRIPDVTAGAKLNFGWPCYEGAGRQAGYAALNLNSCNSLYGSPGAATGPFYSYAHSASVVAGDGCPTGGSSITGMAFNSGSRYPASYAGALFFADYSRNCIWAMQADAAGTPDPTKISLLVSAAAGPVNLQMGPDGYLYYVDLIGGKIHRLLYGAAPAPTPTPGVTYLSDLTAVSATNGWGPYEKDLSNGEDLAGDGRTLTLNGQTYAKGLGTHAGADLHFTVPAGCTSFTSTVGVDDEVGSQGSVSFTVFSGTTQLYASPVLTGSSASGTVGVPVTSGADLRLVSGDGGDGVGYDHADWADAKLTCGTTTAPPPPAPTSGVTYLSDLTAAVSAINGWGPYEKDLSNGEDLAGDGRTLTLNGQTYAKGLGTHAGADLHFTVPAGCTSFTSTVGVDDEVGSLGSVSFTVFSGATQLYASPVLTGSSASGTVSVPVAGGADLRLLVGDGGDGVSYDHGDWADAKLGCGATTPPPTAGNTPPVVTISSPTSSLTWKVGDTIAFAGSAADKEDGALTGSRLSWNLVLRHCPSNQCHSHILGTSVGAAGSLVAIDHDYPSHLELTLTATDSGGLTASSTVSLEPQTVALTFATHPGGLKLGGVAVGSSSTTTPYTRTFIVGASTSVTAPSPQTINSGTYTFQSWSDGGAQSHNFTAPAAAVTYTANYRKR